MFESLKVRRLEEKKTEKNPRDPSPSFRYETERDDGSDWVLESNQ